MASTRAANTLPKKRSPHLKESATRIVVAVTDVSFLQG